MTIGIATRIAPAAKRVNLVFCCPVTHSYKPTAKVLFSALRINNLGSKKSINGPVKELKAKPDDKMLDGDVLVVQESLF